MNLDYYFKAVENVLDEFPIESRKNYYNNKKNLVVNYQNYKNDKVAGSYDNYTNVIEVYDEFSIPHELYHMAFRDSNNVGKKFLDYDNVYYSNGVTLIRYNDENNNFEAFMFKGLTEGLAEYLTQKSGFSREKSIECYFTDLLIFIYGEDIINYALQNNPAGLIMDYKNQNMLEILTLLDNLTYDLEVFRYIILNFQDSYDNSKKKQELTDLTVKYVDNFFMTILSLFENIIMEYQKCDLPLANKDIFLQKLKSFLRNKEFSSFISLMDNGKFNSFNKINSLINNFTNGKAKIYKSKK